MKKYAEFDALLVGRNREQKKLANNTYAIRRGDSIAIRLHETDVVTHHKDGRIVLSSGGWKTPTTKERITSYSPARISQERGVWLFGYGSLGYTFKDGVTLHPDGSVTGAASESDQAKTKKLRKQITEFARKVKDALPLPMPGAGDCWYCCMRTDKGEGLGDATNNTDHLLSHMEEGYLVPSLVLTALEYAKYGDLIKQMTFTDQGDYGKSLAGQYAPRAVRKYLLHKFGLA